MRFRRISYPILPGCREAPTTAVDRGGRTASRPARIIFATKLPGDNEPSSGGWRCIITPGNRALRLIYRDENRGITAHRSARYGTIRMVNPQSGRHRRTGVLVL